MGVNWASDMGEITRASDLADTWDTTVGKCNREQERCKPGSQWLPSRAVAQLFSYWRQTGHNPVWLTPEGCNYLTVKRISFCHGLRAKSFLKEWRQPNQRFVKNTDS